MANKAAKAIKIARLAGTKQLRATVSGDATPGNASGITQSNAQAHHQIARPVTLDLDGNGITVTTKGQGGSVLWDIDDADDLLGSANAVFGHLQGWPHVAPKLIAQGAHFSSGNQPFRLQAWCGEYFENDRMSMPRVCVPFMK
ncbi:MAG: hypothetical protein ACREXV_06300 [Polaromonas sp.]